MYSTEVSSTTALATLTARIQQCVEAICDLQEKQDAMTCEDFDKFEEAENQLIDLLVQREQLLEDSERLRTSIAQKPQSGDDANTGTAVTTFSGESISVFDDFEASCDDEQSATEILGISLLGIELSASHGESCSYDDASLADLTTDSIGLTRRRLETEVAKPIHESEPRRSGAKNLDQRLNYVAKGPMLPMEVNTGGRNCAA